jgi:uncharacterized membrane protein (UPF0182 family)
MQRKFLIPTIFVIVVGFGWLSTYYTNWLWFLSLDYQDIFWRTLRARFLSGVFYGLMAAVVIGTNLYYVGRFTRSALEVGGTPFEGEIPGVGLLKSNIGYILIASVLVLILGNVGSAQWPTVLRYWYGGSFGATDPIFGRDVGFYVFTLPFYQFTIGFLIGTVVVSALASAVIYIAAGGIRIQERIQLMPRPVAHLSILGGLFLFFSAINYRLKIYDLLYSQGNVFFGAGFVDVNLQQWIYWFLAAAFIVTGVLLIRNVKTREARPLLIGVGVYLGGAIGLGTIPGAIVQKLIVDPTELQRESPYIAHNIDATRSAYALNRVKVEPFEASDNLTSADIAANPLTMRNVRIWDERPMVQTYQQVQEIRPYYVFPSVDVDRYTINGVYRQVMLSGRELDTNRLPAQARNWVNERLQYTHGYGVAMSPVTHVTPEGLPSFLIKDIPPVSDSPELQITRPEIYYGERTYGNVVVKTSTEEFDYPRSNGNAFTTYEGNGGVPMGGFFGRLAFSIRMMDPNLLLSSYMTSESRIMFQRQIAQRAREIAPFLFFDSDPYLVVSEGRLYWILDAYTTTNMYPYSKRMGRSQINYIRNTVKIVLDAYHGSITFYQAENGPIISAYAAMFPSLFKPISTMSADLHTHVRYPVDLFRIQATMYREYHMQDVQVFYNQEDLWEIPNEIYRDRPQAMEPYYIIVKLPGEEREEFLLLVPFTPAQKDNMIGWLAARCDGENYGDLLVYTLPKEKLIFGPMQLEARIDQQPEISSQFTLWGQSGSEIIRGNLLAIPIESSFLYVEPIYLQARQEPEPQQNFGEEGGAPQGQRPRNLRQSTAIPELKQVIVAFGGKVVMRPTFEEALNELFGAGTGRTLALSQSTETTTEQSAAQTVADLADEADLQFQQVRESLKNWDWTTAGEAMNKLEQSILELKKSLEK